MRLILITLLCAAPLCAADIFVATTGVDAPGGGTFAAPFATLAYAHSSAASGDHIILRGGTYTGGLSVTVATLTIQSYPGEWAIIASPTTNPAEDAAIASTAGGLTLIDLEITGGYTNALRVDAGPATISHCRLQLAGQTCVVVSPNADGVMLRQCEIENSGQRLATDAHGIECVNGDNFTLQDTHVHDVPGDGIVLRGGARSGLLQRNLVRNCGGAGIVLGGNTPLAQMDPVQNPSYFEGFDCIVRNNIVVSSQESGISCTAIVNPHIYDNTCVSVAQVTGAGIFVDSTDHGGATATDTCTGLIATSNIVQVQTAGGICFDVTASGHPGVLSLSDNRYFNTAGPASFLWEAGGSAPISFSAWKTAAAADGASSEGDPLLNSAYHLGALSPCINPGVNTSGDAVDDFDGEFCRDRHDIGADELGTTALQIPPPAGVIGTGGGPVLGNSAPTVSVAAAANCLVDVNGWFRPASIAVYWDLPCEGYHGHRSFQSVAVAITIDDADGDFVAIDAVIQPAAVPTVLVATEFTHASASAPYILTPTTGILDTKTYTGNYIITLYLADNRGGRTRQVLEVLPCMPIGGYINCGDKDLPGCSASAELLAESGWPLFAALAMLWLGFRSALGRKSK